MSPRKNSSAGKPPWRGEATRARLLKAAHALFLKKGFHGTSVREIADEAGLAVGGIYNHFADKEAIFAAVLDAYHPYHVIFPAMESIQGETAAEFMRQAAQQIYAGVAGTEKRLFPLVFIELVEFQGRHFKQLLEKLLPTVMGFAQRLAQRRGMRPIPPPVVMRAFLSLLVGYFLSEMILKDSPLFRQGKYDWFGGMVDIYLHGIVEPEA
ncbi:MAG TPA: TetR/AcrR family transcriptional regulator [Anaerolineales bacterium]|nr:TetR/AcrR family transcriptional regulator [Anaerolineales bacterium]